ncbi:MAG: 5-(carboxyamino)imidazole ribonucleotide synthase [Phycisphaerae bacterium]
MILPGQTIGILGGGQLGRMFGIAARRMGYRVHSMDPTRDCPAGQVADVEVTADYDDIDAARRFAKGVDVVTFEFENVPAQTLSAIELIRPVRPSPYVLDTCRNRQREKAYLAGHGFPVADHEVVCDALQLRGALSKLGVPCILKSADYGYDGKGQVRITDVADAEAAWKAMGYPVGVLEKLVPFEKEVSVIVCRTLSGETATFEVAENHHERGILDVTIAPARIPPSLAQAAQDLAVEIAHSLKVVGVIAVEMFVVGQNLVVNELAPRPHNSGHFSFDACVTSQFEQQLRCVCGLGLGDTTLLRPAAMANLLGDLWQTAEPDFAALLRMPQVKLHLYGKQKARPGRKMGHLTAVADTPEAARDQVLAARQALTGSLLFG